MNEEYEKNQLIDIYLSIEDEAYKLKMSTWQQSEITANKSCNVSLKQRYINLKIYLIKIPFIQKSYSLKIYRKIKQLLRK